MKVLSLSVRELVSFGETRGDINFRFSSRSTALAGIRGHQRLQKRRGDGYVAETPVTDRISGEGVELCIRGRTDGWYPDSDPLLVEEIKTVRGDAREIPCDVTWLHQAQARVYAWLLVKDSKQASARVRVSYLQLDDDSEVVQEEIITRADLCEFYRSLVEKRLDWQRALWAWHAKRDLAIDSMLAPYGGFRDGQRAMAVSTWQTLANNREMVMQAPTGIGKTMAALYPAIKALRALAYDKIFFLTAKGSGQEAARQAVDDLRETGLELCDITLLAREKSCMNPGVPCHPEQCQYAAGYYDRLPAVLARELAAPRSYGPEVVRSIASEHVLCPFELSLDLSRLADVVICDYNYAFDPSVFLRRYFEDVAGKYTFLVDEAHNLVDRGRDMFSAGIDRGRVMAVRRSINRLAPQVAKRLRRLSEVLLGIKKDHQTQLDHAGYATLEAMPPALPRTLRQFCEIAEEWLADRTDEDLLQLWFDAMRFLRIEEAIDDGYRIVLEEGETGLAVKIINLNPAAGLRTAFDRASASICFSGTLSPRRYYERLTGLSTEATWYRVPSPFPAANQGTFVVPWISTAFRDRAASLDALVSTVHQVVSARRGHYLVFLPSHAYLESTALRFSACYPEIEVMSQQRHMDETARQQFLSRFSAGGEATLVAFAVMGGVFAEGIDLAGDQLIGVIVAGVGLPGISPERELMSDYFGGEDREEGFRYAYQYPGIGRVLQTAGRVIRSESDRGVVCLIDRRFTEARYRELLPPDWQVSVARTPEDLDMMLRTFWCPPAVTDES